MSLVINTTILVLLLKLPFAFSAGLLSMWKRDADILSVERRLFFRTQHTFTSDITLKQKNPKISTTITKKESFYNEIDNKLKVF